MLLTSDKTNTKSQSGYLIHQPKFVRDTTRIKPEYVIADITCSVDN